MWVPGRDLVHGVDVSRWQGGVRWDAFDLDFAILKASGGDGGLYTDGQFANNARWPRPWGAYHFAGGTSPNAEADYFIARLREQPGWTLPPVLDWEPPRFDPALALTWVLRFCERVEDELQVRPMIYTGAYVALARDRALLAYSLWLAAYTPQPIACAPWGDRWTAWQYTSTGRVPGIAGNVDMNVADRAWFLSHVTGPQPATVSAVTPSPFHTEDGVPKQMKFPDGTTYVMVPALDKPRGWAWQHVQDPQVESDAFYCGAISRDVQPLAQQGTDDFDAAFGRYVVLDGPHKRDTVS